MKHSWAKGQGAVRHPRHTAAHQAIVDLCVHGLEDNEEDEEPVWFGSVLTAACYSKPTLHLATIRMKAERRFELKEERCASFTLAERDPAATRELHEKVSRFLKKRRINDVVLRTGVMRGSHVPHGLAFKAEAVLDLVLGSSLYRVDAASVANWLRKQDIELPDAQDLGFPVTWRAGQQKTIDAAAFALLDGKIFRGEKECPR